MGRFFKGAIPQFVQDKMFKLPAELMFQAIQQTDKNIDESIDKVDAFNGLLDIENINTDDPSVNTALDNYRKDINDLSQKINKSPLDYRKYRTDISKLSNRLDDDLSKGILGKAQEQKTNLDAELERVNGLKGVSNERKDLVKQAIQNRYNNVGGLNFQDRNNYNQISDFFENPLEEFDEEAYINTIGANFEADVTAKSFASADNKGYIRNGSNTVAIRSEEDVANYVIDSLKDGTWEAQKRQLYTLKRDAGVADYTDNQIEQLVEQDRQSLINKAKNKLGFRKETKQSSLKSDGTYMSKWANAQRKLAAGDGVILEEVRDPRLAVNGEFSNTDKSLVTSIDKKIKGLMGYDSHKDLYDKVFTGNNKTENIKELREQLLNQGIPYTDFVTYMNYNLGVEKLETPHPDQYDPQNPDDLQTQQNLLNGIVTAINNRNPNEDVSKIRTSTSDGTYFNTDFNSVGEMISKGVDEGFIYLPATSTSTKKVWKTGPNGNFVDDEGQVITDPTTNNPISNYEQAIRAGVANNVIVDTEQVANVVTDENLFKADKGNVKQVKNKRIDVLNREKNNKEYVVTNQYLKVNQETGKSELINVDVYIDSNKIGVKQ